MYPVNVTGPLTGMAIEIFECCLFPAAAGGASAC
jgi:hypothetical protein